MSCRRNDRTLDIIGSSGNVVDTIATDEWGIATSIVWLPYRIYTMEMVAANGEYNAAAQARHNRLCQYKKDCYLPSFRFQL